MRFFGKSLITKKQYIPKSASAESNRLHHSQYDLEQKYEEVDHEIERGIASKRLVYRPVPADETEGGQQDEVQDGQAERGEAEASEHYRHGAHDVERQDERVD